MTDDSRKIVLSDKKKNRLRKKRYLFKPYRKPTFPTIGRELTDQEYDDNVEKCRKYGRELYKRLKDESGRSNTRRVKEDKPEIRSDDNQYI